MVESTDSLDFVPDLSISQKRNVIPIDCWQDICLSKIWIPESLLPNRKKSSNTRATQGIYHTLEKRGQAQCIKSFSVYSDYDVESEQEEIFLSDSDEDILDLDNVSLEDIEKESPKNALAASVANTSLRDIRSNSKPKDTANGNLSLDFCKNKLSENVEDIGNLSKLKSLPSLNNLSIIDNEECAKLASSFEKLMKYQLTHYRENNISNESYSKKENTVKRNVFESFGSSSECDRNSNKNDKIINVQENEILNSEDKNEISNIALDEILDTTTEVNMRDFMCDFTIKTDKYSSMQEETVESNKKRNKKDKKKKKALKAVTLDKFLEDYDEDKKQEDYCNDYLRKILSGRYNDKKLQITNSAQFPDLASSEFQFIHSEKSERKTNEPSPKTVVEILTKSSEDNENQSEDNYDAKPVTTESADSLGKFVIENIPSEVSHDDICSLLCGCGEIKELTLEADGDFLKATVEIDLMCKLDWMIDCYNGSQPFGASSRMLKCYKLE